MTRDVLATWRLVRLAREDELTEPLRSRFLAWAIGPNPARGALHPRLAYLADCPWCLSPWAALVVLVLRRRAPWLRDALALSQVVGLGHEVVDLIPSVERALLPRLDVSPPPRG